MSPFLVCLQNSFPPASSRKPDPHQRVFVTISHFWSLYTTASTNNNNCMRTAHGKLLTMTPHHHHHQHFTTCLFADHSTISHTTRDPIIMRRKKIPFNEFKSFEIDYAKWERDNANIDEKSNYDNSKNNYDDIIIKQKRKDSLRKESKTKNARDHIWICSVLQFPPPTLSWSFWKEEKKKQ